MEGHVVGQFEIDNSPQAMMAALHANICAEEEGGLGRR